MFTRKRANAEPSGDAAAVGRFELYEIKRRPLEGETEFVDHMQVFTHRQRYADRAGDLSISILVAGYDRFFEPDQMEGLKRICRDDGAFSIKCVIRIDDECNILPPRARREPSQRLLQVCSVRASS